MLSTHKPRRKKKRKGTPRPGAEKHFGNKVYRRPLGWSPSFEGANPGGRPRVYESAAMMSKRCLDYFEKCRKGYCSLGIFGLSLHLGLIYTTFLDYESGARDFPNVSDEEKYSYILKLARMTIASASERSLMSGANAAGPIFHLQQISRRLGEQWKHVGSNEVTGKDGKDLPVGPTIVLPDNGRGDLYSPPANGAGT